MPARDQVLIAGAFHAETIEKLDARYDTSHLWECPAGERDALIRSLDGSCRAVACASWDCDEIVYGLGSLEIIAAFGVGVDGIDFEKTAAAGVRVTNTPDVLTDATADIAIALILATMRGAVRADRFVREGAWAKGPFPFGRDLAGRTLGILGLGRIGEAVARRALPFGMNIAYHNRARRDLPWRHCPDVRTLARESDILLCLLPGGPGTRRLVDADALRALGPDGVFINVGRGSSVDEEALADALESGRIRAAGLDVYASEPDVPERLRALDNTVLFPHIGSATVETRRAMGERVLENLAAHFAGRPLVSEVK